MTDLPHSPYLDLPLRTLREVADERWKAACRSVAAYDRAKDALHAATKQVEATRCAYFAAYDAWLAADAADKAAAQRAA